MDPVLNPYSPGAGLRPPQLAGRDREILDFATLRHRAAEHRSSRSVVMSGLRGVGKTVLLNELATSARSDGWIVGKIEADRDDERSFREQVAGTLNRALREAKGSWDIAGRWHRALSTFKSFSLRTDPSGSLSIGVEIDPERGRGDTGALETDLADLTLDLAAAVADRGMGAVLFIDELQDLTRRDLAAVCHACHEAGQRNAQFYVIGAGLPSLPGALADARSYAERLFDYWSIGALDATSAADALVRPAADVGVGWDEDAVNTLVEHSAGYPYFLQEFGKAAWDFAAGPQVSADDAAVGIQVGTMSLDRGFFTSRWERATPTERDYMRAMADDGDGPSQSGEIARRLGKRSTSVGPTRSGLIHKGLVYAPEHGLISFTVPGMADFITRQPSG
ncbi:MAG: ATP-binding protein [Acidimicrobiales bacterium]